MTKDLLIGVCILAMICFQCGEVDRSESIQFNESLLDLLLDIQTARVVIDKSPPAERDSLSAIYWPQIMKLHDLSEDQLDELMDELRKHPEKYDTLFLAMSQKLDSIRNQMER